jgi:hypothetical protein
MKATNKLRFVERSQPDYPGSNTGRIVRILQQWWEDSYVMLSVHVTDKDGNVFPSPSRGEWRDVPVEVEA